MYRCHTLGEMFSTCLITLHAVKTCFEHMLDGWPFYDNSSLCN